MLDDVIKLLLSPFVIVYKATLILSDIVAWCVDKLWELWKGRKKDERPLGDADWATDKELGEAGRLILEGWLVGTTESGQNVYTDKESSAVLIAQKGLGKSLTIEAHIRDILKRRNTI